MVGRSSTNSALLAQEIVASLRQHGVSPPTVWEEQLPSLLDKHIAPLQHEISSLSASLNEAQKSLMESVRSVHDIASYEIKLTSLKQKLVVAESVAKQSRSKLKEPMMSLCAHMDAFIRMLRVAFYLPKEWEETNALLVVETEKSKEILDVEGGDIGWGKSPSTVNLNGDDVFTLSGPGIDLAVPKSREERKRLQPLPNSVLNMSNNSSGSPSTSTNAAIISSSSGQEKALYLDDQNDSQQFDSHHNRQRRINNNGSNNNNNNEPQSCSSSVSTNSVTKIGATPDDSQVLASLRQKTSFLRNFLRIWMQDGDDEISPIPTDPLLSESTRAVLDADCTFRAAMRVLEERLRFLNSLHDETITVRDEEMALLIKRRDMLEEAVSKADQGLEVARAHFSKVTEKGVSVTSEEITQARRVLLRAQNRQKESKAALSRFLGSDAWQRRVRAISAEIEIELAHTQADVASLKKTIDAQSRIAEAHKQDGEKVSSAVCVVTQLMAGLQIMLDAAAGHKKDENNNNNSNNGGGGAAAGGASHRATTEKLLVESQDHMIALLRKHLNSLRKVLVSAGLEDEPVGRATDPQHVLDIAKNYVEKSLDLLKKRLDDATAAQREIQDASMALEEAEEEKNRLESALETAKNAVVEKEENVRDLESSQEQLQSKIESAEMFLFKQKKLLEAEEISPTPSRTEIERQRELVKRLQNEMDLLMSERDRIQEMLEEAQIQLEEERAAARRLQERLADLQLLIGKKSEAMSLRPHTPSRIEQELTLVQAQLQISEQRGEETKKTLAVCLRGLARVLTLLNSLLSVAGGGPGGAFGTFFAPDFDDKTDAASVSSFSSLASSGVGVEESEEKVVAAIGHLSAMLSRLEPEKEKTAAKESVNADTSKLSNIAMMVDEAQRQSAFYFGRGNVVIHEAVGVARSAINFLKIQCVCLCISKMSSVSLPRAVELFFNLTCDERMVADFENGCQTSNIAGLSLLPIWSSILKNCVVQNHRLWNRPHIPRFQTPVQFSFANMPPYVTCAVEVGNRRLEEGDELCCVNGCLVDSSISTSECQSLLCGPEGLALVCVFRRRSGDRSSYFSTTLYCNTATASSS